MIDIREVIKLPEYNWIEQYKDRICFLALGGSHAYGTNVEGSDIDLRGVVLPTKRDLLGFNKFVQKNDDSTDTVLYEVNRFMNLASQTNPNIVELLGSPQHLVFNDIGYKILDNRDIFISKRCINTFGGYANQQLRRVENSLAHDAIDEATKAKRIKDVIDVTKAKLSDRTSMFKENEIDVNVVDGQLSWKVNVNGRTTQELKDAINTLTTIERDFDKIGQRNNKLTEAKLNKHIMHLVRLYNMVFDILEKGEIITYRPERDFLLDIRKGKYIVDGELSKEFRDYLDVLQHRLDEDKKLTVIPERCDLEKVEDLMIDINESIIKNTVYSFEPRLEYNYKPHKIGE